MSFQEFVNDMFGTEVDLMDIDEESLLALEDEYEEENKK